MNRKNTIIALGIFFCNLCFGQTTDNTKNNFTLKQCVDYALQNQSSIKNATINEAIANAKVKEVTGMGLPQVKGTVQLSNNDPLRRMFLAGNSPLVKSFFPPQTAQEVAQEKVIAVPNFFQLPSSGDAGFSGSQLIFSASYIVGLQAAKTYKELSSKATQQTKIQVTEAVTKAYYLVLVNQERMKLLESNVARIDSLLKQIKAMYENGFVESIDADRMQVTYNNITTEKEKFDNLLLLSKMLLKYQMSMPLENELELSEKMNDFKVEDITPSVQKPNYSGRIEYSLMESQRKLQQLDLRSNKSVYFPSLAIFGSVGTFSQSPKFDYFSSTNLWYGYGMYGMTLTIPVFDGFQSSYKIKQSKLNLKKTENDFANLERAIDLQIKSSEINLKNSLRSLESQSKNIQLAKEVARVTKIKYQEGVGTSLELTTAETALLEAQTNYFNALYDALVAKVDYEKANGIIK